MRPLLTLLPTLLLANALLGCIPMPTPEGGATLSRADALHELARLEQSPKPLARPLVILNGYRSPAFMLGGMLHRLAHATSGDAHEPLLINFFDESDFNAMADRVSRRVQERWPSPTPGETIEVDVIGVSMGGLVARLAAAPDPRESPRPRLNIRRLFTLATPHRGARIARWIAIDQPARDMRENSAFLDQLNQADAPRYELVCYAHLRDITVGATHTAPEGLTPIWTGGTFLFSHNAIAQNPIILADLARRLRNEAPLLAPDQPPPRD